MSFESTGLPIVVRLSLVKLGAEREGPRLSPRDSLVSEPLCHPTRSNNLVSTLVIRVVSCDDAGDVVGTPCPAISLYFNQIIQFGSCERGQITVKLWRHQIPSLRERKGSRTEGNSPL